MALTVKDFSFKIKQYGAAVKNFCTALATALVGISLSVICLSLEIAITILEQNEADFTTKSAGLTPLLITAVAASLVSLVVEGTSLSLEDKIVWDFKQSISLVTAIVQFLMMTGESILHLIHKMSPMRFSLYPILIVFGVLCTRIFALRSLCYTQAYQLYCDEFGIMDMNLDMPSDGQGGEGRGGGQRGRPGARDGAKKGAIVLQCPNCQHDRCHRVT